MSLVLATDLQRDKDAKKAIKKETYKKILEQVSRKIKNASSGGQEALVVTIPMFVMGCPTFNQATATIYIQRQLINGGYKVQQINPVNLLVDWSREPRPQAQAGGPTLGPPRARRTERDVLEEEYQLPSLINLKKYAERYK